MNARDFNRNEIVWVVKNMSSRVYSENCKYSRAANFNVVEYILQPSQIL